MIASISKTVRAAITCAGAGLILLATVSVLLAGHEGFNNWFVAGAVTPYLVIGGIAVGGVGTHHPYDRFGAGNAITFLRLVMVCLFAGFVAQTLAADDVSPATAWGFSALVLVAMLLDGVDGHVARKQGLTSAFGARFDMETDAVFILLLCLAAVALGKVGAWVLLGGLLRYVYVAAGWIWPVLAQPLPPSQRRKIVCVIQIGALALLVIPIVLPPLSSAIAFASLVLLVYSFAADTLWSLRAVPHLPPPPP